MRFSINMNDNESKFWLLLALLAAFITALSFYYSINQTIHANTAFTSYETTTGVYTGYQRIGRGAAPKPYHPIVKFEVEEKEYIVTQKYGITYNILPNEGTIVTVLYNPESPSDYFIEEYKAYYDWKDLFYFSFISMAIFILLMVKYILLRTDSYRADKIFNFIMCLLLGVFLLLLVYFVFFI